MTNQINKQEIANRILEILSKSPIKAIGLYNAMDIDHGEAEAVSLELIGKRLIELPPGNSLLYLTKEGYEAHLIGIDKYEELLRAKTEVETAYYSDGIKSFKEQRTIQKRTLLVGVGSVIINALLTAVTIYFTFCV